MGNTTDPGRPAATPVALVTVAFTATVALALAGCDPGAATAGGTVVRDSAGVTIVENDPTRPALGEAGLGLGPDPVLRIGSVDAAGPEQFGQVRHAAFLRGGEIAVVDGQTAEVRIFDPRGRHLRTLGGEGDGPGEFRSLWRVEPMAGDSIMVVDLYRAVSVFDAGGRFARRFVPGGAEGESQGPPLGTFGDGSLLFMRYQPSDPSRVGVGRSRVELVRVATDGTLVRSFGLFDHQTVHYGGGSSYLFGPRAEMVPSGSGLLYAPGDRFQIRSIDSAGRTTRLVRLDVEPAAVTEAHRQAWMDGMIRSNPNMPEELVRRAMGELESPPRFPFHGPLVADDRGGVWVREYEVPGTREPGRWFVFDEEGRYLGPVTTPPGFVLYEVRDDRVLGRWEDEVGVDYMSVYPLEGGDS